MPGLVPPGMTMRASCGCCGARAPQQPSVIRAPARTALCRQERSPALGRPMAPSGNVPSEKTPGSRSAGDDGEPRSRRVLPGGGWVRPPRHAHGAIGGDLQGISHHPVHVLVTSDPKWSSRRRGDSYLAALWRNVLPWCPRNTELANQDLAHSRKARITWPDLSRVRGFPAARESHPAREQSTFRWTQRTRFEQVRLEASSEVAFAARDG